MWLLCGSDVDLAHIRNVWGSYLRLLDVAEADAAMMLEVDDVNIGNLVVRPNPRTLALYEAFSSPERVNRQEGFHNSQEMFKYLPGKGLCHSTDECLRLKQQGLVAIFRYCAPASTILLAWIQGTFQVICSFKACTAWQDLAGSFTQSPIHSKGFK